MLIVLDTFEGSRLGWLPPLTALGPLPTWDRGTDYFRVLA